MLSRPQALFSLLGMFVALCLLSPCYKMAAAAPAQVHFPGRKAEKGQALFSWKVVLLGDLVLQPHQPELGHMGNPNCKGG